MQWRYEIEPADGSVMLFLDGVLYSALAGSASEESTERRTLRAARFVLDLANGIVGDEGQPAPSVRSFLKATAATLEAIAEAERPTTVFR